MPRRWHNGGGRDSATDRSACGCRPNREHRCLGEEREQAEARPKRGKRVLAPWAARELERVNGTERSDFLRSIGRLPKS